MDTPEYLAEQLELAERRVQENDAAGDVAEAAWWRARLKELERRARRLRSLRVDEAEGPG